MFMQNFNQGTIGFYFFSASGSTSTTITLTVWNLGVGSGGWHEQLNDMVLQNSVTIDLSPTVATRADVSFHGLLFHDMNPYNTYDTNFDRISYYIQIQTSDPVKMAFLDIPNEFAHGMNYNDAYNFWDWSSIYWTDNCVGSGTPSNCGDSFWMPFEVSSLKTAFVDIQNVCPT